MDPVVAFVMPIILTTIFGLSLIAVYELMQESTIGRWISATVIALLGALSLDIAISIIIGG